MNRRGFFKTMAVAALGTVGLGKLADWMAPPCNHIRHIGPSTIGTGRYYDCTIYHWTPEMIARYADLYRADEECRRRNLDPGMYRDWFMPRKDHHA